jgi:hypothetical protein
VLSWGGGEGVLVEEGGQGSETYGAAGAGEELSAVGVEHGLHDSDTHGVGECKNSKKTHQVVVSVEKSGERISHGWGTDGHRFLCGVGGGGFDFGVVATGGDW